LAKRSFPGKSKPDWAPPASPSNSNLEEMVILRMKKFSVHNDRQNFWSKVVNKALCICHHIVYTICETHSRCIIVKQLDSLSTSEWLGVNVSNECIPKVGACLYTNRLHQTYIMWNSCAAWWNKFGETEWHVRHESAWRNTNIALHTILVILYDTLFIL
jgi:hypothetical protein